MAFSLNGTHIEGSTFNNVSGNMSQVYNSHVVHVGPRLLLHDAREDRPLIAGVHDFPAAARTHGSIGPIRTQRALRNQDTRPYGVGSGGPSEMYPVIEYAAPADPQTRMAFYSPQLHPPSGNYPSSAPAPAMANENDSRTESQALIYFTATVAMEALHNSGERFEEPACHLGTADSDAGTAWFVVNRHQP
ncbi:hypothetical protein DFH09DRAFT_1284845 [Mycena vulgaris]|nr:hypothetical protein DFH09DRAFT_1284845 [Mycena vulgaris]